MQMNQISGKPIGFGFSTGPSSNFLNPVNSKSDTAAISSLKSSMSTHQSALTSSCTDSRILSSSKISQTSDVIKTLREHPAYMDMPEGELEAIAAALLSTGCLAGGITLLALSGGATAPLSVTLASIVLTAAGGTGTVNAIEGAIRGKFDWREWSEDVTISAGTSLITFGAGYALATGVTSLCLNHRSINLTTRFIETIAEISGATAAAAVQGTTYSIIKEYSGEEIEIFELFVQCVGGAFAGAAAGKKAFEAQLKPLIRANKIIGRHKGKGFNTEPVELRKGNAKMNVFVTEQEIIGHDIGMSAVKERIRCKTPKGGRVLVLSGTHGEPTGRTALENITLGDQGFFESDLQRIPDLFKNRVATILNLAEYRELNALRDRIIEIQPDTIVFNFCYGDRAMANGRLGQQINEAFEILSRPNL